VDGVPKLFYTHTGANNLSQVYMARPSQPVRYEIRGVGLTSSGTFIPICSGVSIEGTLSALQRVRAVYNMTTVALPTSGVTYPVLGIRLSESTRYMGISGLVKLIDILQISNDNYIMTLQMAPTLSGTPSWTTVSNTPMEYAEGNGVITVSSPGAIISSFLGLAGSLSQNTIPVLESVFSFGYGIDGRSVEWWICLEPLSGNASLNNHAYYISI
jgi:hypothetical protein